MRRSRRGYLTDPLSKCPICFAAVEPVDSFQSRCTDCKAEVSNDGRYLLTKKGLTRLRRSDRRGMYQAYVQHLTLLDYPNHQGTYERTIQHDVTVQAGFQREIPARLIASRQNTRIIPLRKNLTIGTRITERGKANLREWERKGLLT